MKNFKKIILATLVIVSLFASNVSAEEKWYFVDGKDLVQGPYPTSAECMAALQSSPDGFTSSCYKDNNTTTECTFNSAKWNPAGDQDKEKFYREGVTANIEFKTKNCLDKSGITISIYEADSCPIVNCDDGLVDSKLWRRQFNIPSDNFIMQLKLGEEECEAGATLAIGYDCDLFFIMRDGDKELYNSWNEVGGNLDYECDGACDINAALLKIVPEGSNDEPVKDPVINVNAKKALEKKDTYTLLAPIGDFKEINTKGGTCPGNPDIENGVGCYLNIIFKIAIGLCGALAVIMIVIGGITYMGTESVFGKTEAKSRIFSALMGLFIALGAYAILNTINPALTGKEGVSVDQVTAEIDDESETEPVTTYYQVTGKTKLCTSGYTDVNTFGNGDAKQPKKINICNSINGIKIANNLQDMINEAKKSNVILSGYGSRSYDRQVQLRKDHKCPDVYNSPASTCKPPTARPGHSNHEVGGAVDFTCNGQSMVEAGGRNSPCFKWLSTHASGYKFYNLKSESWHWSFNGK